MENPFISVILPTYNGEKTIRRCIDSMLAQHFTDFELIIIDDGSVDKTYSICHDYYMKNSCVKLYRKPNGGESSARNMGLLQAKGEWITFIDHDDYVDDDYLFSFVSMENMRKDTLYIVGEKEGFTTRDLKPQKGIYDSGDMDQRMLSLLSDNGTTWGKLFYRRTLEQQCITFNENVFYGGDKLFTMQYAAHVDRVVYNPNTYPYNYVNYFNPVKFIKSFPRELENYKQIRDVLRKTYGERFRNEWLQQHFKLLFFSIYALKSDRKERYEKIHILFDTLDEAEQVVDIMASTPSRLQGLWKRVGRGDYLLADICLSWAIPLVVWLFDCRYIPTSVKRFCKQAAG